MKNLDCILVLFYYVSFIGSLIISLSIALTLIRGYIYLLEIINTSKSKKKNKKVQYNRNIRKDILLYESFDKQE